MTQCGAGGGPRLKGWISDISGPIIMEGRSSAVVRAMSDDPAHVKTSGRLAAVHRHPAFSTGYKLRTPDDAAKYMLSCSGAWIQEGPAT